MRGRVIPFPNRRPRPPLERRRRAEEAASRRLIIVEPVRRFLDGDGDDDPEPHHEVQAVWHFSENGFPWFEDERPDQPEGSAPHD